MSENKYTEDFFKEYEQKYMRNENTAPNTVNRSGRHKRSRKSSTVPLIMFCVAVGVIISLIVGLIIFLVSSIGEIDDSQSKSTDNSALVQKAEQKPIDKSIPLPTFTDATQQIGANINSEYGVFINLTDNLVVADKNSNVKIYPASLTKILTLLVAVENIKDFNDTFTMTSAITDPAFQEGASVAGFVPDEVITIDDLLYGAILPSGADATSALAQYVSGSEAEFVKLMNKKVKELGITTAHFMNASGLHHENHYCTVMDIMRIMRAAMENEKCKQILSTYQYTTSVTEQHPNGILLTSTMFSRMYGDEPEIAKITGGKTGFTNEAGNCLASFGVGENGKEYIFVTTMAHGSWKAIFDHINGYKKYAK